MRPATRPSVRFLHLVALSLPWVAACQGALQPSSNPAPPVTDTTAKSTAAPAAPSSAEPTPSAAPAAAETPPPAPRSLWSVKSPGQTASLVDVINGRVYAHAGEYLEFGSPTRHVMAIDAATGEVLWSKDMGKAALFADSFVAHNLFTLQSTEGKTTVLDAATGAPSNKTAPVKLAAPQPSFLCAQASLRYGCVARASGEKLFELHGSDPIGAIYEPPGLVCVTQERALTIECHDANSGKALFRHAVPRLPSVKEPDEIHFTYRIVERRLFVAQYDGTIAAFEFDR